MIRILYLITSSDFGGAETLFYQQVTTLDQKRFVPLVCSIKPLGKMARNLRERGFDVTSLNLDLRREALRPWLLVAKIIALKKLIRSFGPDVIHASLFQADVMGAVAGFLLRVPVRIVTIHTVVRNKFHELIVERALSPFISRYLAISGHMRDFLVSKLFLSPDKIAVIVNAVDGEDLRKKAELGKALADGIGFDFPWILMASRLDPEKDVKTLLRSIQILISRRVDVGLVLIGDGPEQDMLQREAHRMGIGANVRFMGFQNNPMPFIAQSRAVCLSSREEGLPMVILEAMALGKPVISTSVGAIPEAVKTGVNGFLVPPGDPEALSAAIEQLVRDEPLAIHMGEQGRAIHQENFSMPGMTAKLGRLYEDLYSKRKGESAWN